MRPLTSVLLNLRPYLGILLTAREELLKINFEFSGTPVDKI